MKKLLCWVACVAVVSAVTAADAPPAVEVKSERVAPGGKADGFKITARDEAVLIDFNDPRGIGTARVTAQRWPKSVVLRFRLGGLESLRVTAGKTTLHLAVQSSGKHAVLLEVEKEGKRREVGAKDPLRATVRMLDGEGKPTDRLPDPAKDGRFEVTLPAALFEGADGDLVLSWVDFYRN